MKVFRVVAGTVVEVTGFFPYESAFTGGVWLACADLDGDSRDEVIVGPGHGRAPEVRVFGVSAIGPSFIAAWMAYEEAFPGGVRVAAANHPGGIVAPFQVVTTPGPGRPISLRTWAVGGGSAVQVADGLVYAATALGGALVAAGDLDGDGGLDLGIAADVGTPSLLRIFSMTALQFIADAPTGAAGFIYGLREAIGALTGGPGRPELVAGHGGGGAPLIHVFTLSPGAGVLRVAFPALEVP